MLMPEKYYFKPTKHLKSTDGPNHPLNAYLRATCNNSAEPKLREAKSNKREVARNYGYYQTSASPNQTLLPLTQL